MKNILIMLVCLLIACGGTWWGFLTADSGLVLLSSTAAVLEFICLIRLIKRYFKTLF